MDEDGLRMGHVQSKRKKERKRRKISQLSEIMKNMTLPHTDSENIHQVAGHRIYRDSSNLDQLSTSSGYFSSNEPSPQSPPGNEVTWVLGSEVDPDGDYGRYKPEESSVSQMSALEELYTYKGFPIEDHHELSKLQNEQNARLENMELRMSKIRTSAQQAYDRKRFAHMFRAKKVDSKTEKLLQEARDILQQNVQSRTSGPEKLKSHDYAGEIIPVQILEDEKEETTGQEPGYLHLASFGSLQLSEPVLLLILPFLLPLFIIVAIIRGMSETFGWKQVPWKPKSRRNS